TQTEEERESVACSRSIPSSGKFCYCLLDEIHVLRGDGAGFQHVPSIRSEPSMCACHGSEVPEEPFPLGADKILGVSKRIRWMVPAIAAAAAALAASWIANRGSEEHARLTPIGSAEISPREP